jgi:hypothetical protein
MKIYKCKDVREVESFYGDLLFGFKTEITVHQYLKSLSKRLWKGIKNHDSAVQYEIKNHHPAYINGEGEGFFKNNLKKKDSRLTIAREFGFRKWKGLKKLGVQKFDVSFEMAIENLLNGDVQALESLLKENPKLINKRSKFGHKATLLHYTASNGVEIWRQRVPENLPQVTQCLLDYGADKNAKMEVYRSEFDTLALLESSVHPFDAGVGEEMLKVLTAE